MTATGAHITASAPIRAARARVSRARDSATVAISSAAQASSRKPRAERRRGPTTRRRASNRRSAAPSSVPSASIVLPRISSGTGIPSHARTVGAMSTEETRPRCWVVGEVSVLREVAVPGRPAAPSQRSCPPGPCSTRCTTISSSPGARCAARGQSCEVPGRRSATTRARSRSSASVRVGSVAPAATETSATVPSVPAAAAADRSVGRVAAAFAHAGVNIRVRHSPRHRGCSTRAGRG